MLDMLEQSVSLVFVFNDYRCKKGNYMEDQLSALPNEIIIDILSLLTMKEVARTSVPSLKWKNLWKFFTGSLNFDASKTKASMRQEIETMSLETERSKYFEDSCTFPLSPFGVLSFNTLTSLCSKSVDLTEDVLAHFLSNCPLIEELSLMRSRSLVNLKIDGPQKLKYLELSYCFSLQNLEILATNLISFKYHGPYIINNPLKNVPLLSEVSIGGCNCTDLVCLTFSRFSGVLSQLETLVLDLDSLVSQKSHLIPNIFPEFCNLKRLEL